MPLVCGLPLFNSFILFLDLLPQRPRTTSQHPRRDRPRRRGHLRPRPRPQGHLATETATESRTTAIIHPLRAETTSETLTWNDRRPGGGGRWSQDEVLHALSFPFWPLENFDEFIIMKNQFIRKRDIMFQTVPCDDNSDQPNSSGFSVFMNKI